MRKITLALLLIAATVAFAQETVKSMALKLKYTPPAGWNTEEFGGKVIPGKIRAMPFAIVPACCSASRIRKVS